MHGRKRRRTSEPESPVARNPLDAMKRRNFLIAGIAAGTSALAGAGGFLWLKRRRRGRRNKAVAAAYVGDATPLKEINDSEIFDVCIVGSGPAGVALGTQLAKAGLRTLMLEGGLAPGKDPRYAALSVAEASGDAAYPLQSTRFLAPGGTTAIWTGNTPRLRPIDFQVNAYTPEGAAWPIDYETIEPYYGRAEQMLRTRGDGQAYGIPRSTPLPPEDKPGNALARQMLARLDIPSLTTFKSDGPDGGPVRVGRDLLPDFVALAPATLVLGAVARRFQSSGGESIDSVLVQEIGGAPRPLMARAYVLAAGAVESARRLLLSTSDRSPNGIGNDFDQVGRRFHEHPGVRVEGYVSIAPGDDQQVYQMARSYKFYEAFKREGLGSITLRIKLDRREETDRVASLELGAALEMYPAPDNRVTLSPHRDPLGDPIAHLQFSFSPQDHATMARARGLLHDIATKLQARNLQAPPDVQWAHHHLGTVPMGVDPRTSVVDANLRVHGMKNLFVLTSGNFVTSGPANPTLTIVALAHRLAEHLVGELAAH
jgi:choline dehydrogenase-like flavoprotein